MFCSYCGKIITDDSIFCAHCGKTVAVMPSDSISLDHSSIQHTNSYANTNLTDSRENNANNTNVIIEEQRILFTARWRKFIKSPLVLITIIVHSISLLLNLAEIFTVTEIYDSLIFFFGDFSVSLLKIQSVGNILLNIPLAIGMWMTYADGYSKKNKIASKNGLYLLYAYTNLYFIGTVIIFVLIGLNSLFIIDDLGVMVSFTLFFAMSVSAGIVAICHWIISSILENTENSFDNGSINSGKIRIIAIPMIIFGGILALSFVTQFSLSTLFSSAFSILIGCVMLSFKNTLETIRIEQE